MVTGKYGYYSRVSTMMKHCVRSLYRATVHIRNLCSIQVLWQMGHCKENHQKAWKPSCEPWTIVYLIKTWNGASGIRARTEPSSKLASNFRWQSNGSEGSGWVLWMSRILWTTEAAESASPTQNCNTDLPAHVLRRTFGTNVPVKILSPPRKADPCCDDSYRTSALASVHLC